MRTTMKITKKAEKLLAATPGLHLHNNKLRVVFRLPGETKPTKRSLKLEPTEPNILFAANKLGTIKQDITFGLYSNDPEAFWLKHFPEELQSKAEQTPTLKEVLYAKYNDLLYTWSGSSQRSYGYAVSTVSQYLGHLPVDQVRSSHVRELQKKLLSGEDRHKPLASRTVNMYLKQSQYLLDLYLEELGERTNQIYSNPFKKVPALKEGRSFSDDEDQDVYPFSPQELSRILEYLAKNPLKHRLVRWMVYTGMRPGEIVALAWEDIDLEANVVKVRYNYSRHSNGLKLPKTTHGRRTIELLPQAAEVLAEMFPVTGHLPGELMTVTEHYNKTKEVLRRNVFLYRSSKGVFRRLHENLTFPTVTWGRILNKVDVPYRRPYQLRHTYASWALMNGADPMWVARQMGHSDWGVIRTVYGKWIPQAMQSPAQLLGSKLGGFVPYTSPKPGTQEDGEKSL
ncbi:site-specific integrase [Oceanimonas pelagia]|uniref:Site-specific integrase n=1 Tax=Oceanimonas pelagia TaxID=3028314 RepID=A0AA50QAV3_9GAMM|nr:site-specific integrase [Oceanimonas pelagia]WMC09577.1 site-specific integrase [Oceanimonas pelagia]